MMRRTPCKLGWLLAALVVPPSIRAAPPPLQEVEQEAPAEPAEADASAGPVLAAPQDPVDFEELLRTVLTERSLSDMASPFTSGERRDLTLEEAVVVALQNDLGLQQEAIGAEIAGYNYVGSWGAFDPVVRAVGRLTDAESQPSTTLGGAQVLEVDVQALEFGLNYPLITGGNLGLDYARNNTKTNNQFQLVNPATEDSLTLALTQPLLRGAWRDFATSEQQEAELELTRVLEQVRTARGDLIFRVHQAYWNLVSAREQLGVAQTSLELGLQQLEQNQRRLDAGVGTEVEVLQAQTNVATSVQVRLEAAVNVARTSDQLKTILFPGSSEETWNLYITPTTPLPQGVSSEGLRSWQEELVTALEYRGELRQQRLRIDASEVALERSSSLRLPALDLVLSAGANGFDGDPSTSFREAIGYEFPTYTAALNFSMPIGNRSASNAERAARAQVRNARLSYDQLETQVVAEVRDAVLQLVSRIAAVRAAESSLQLATRQLEAEQARYREGLTTNFQVLEFQDQLAQALSVERRARVDYALAWTNLYGAQGTLVERFTGTGAGSGDENR